MIKFLSLYFLLSLIYSTALAQSADFVHTKNIPEKVSCKLVKNTLQFSDLAQSYRFYDKNISSIKLAGCEKIKIKDNLFYTVLYSSTVNELGANQKVLFYEVILANHKSKIPQTVRSEIVDQIDLAVDANETQFQYAIQTQWGTNKADNLILLKITIANKKEKPFPYLLKFNPKSAWFENVF